MELWARPCMFVIFYRSSTSELPSASYRDTHRSKSFGSDRTDPNHLDRDLLELDPDPLELDPRSPRLDLNH